MFQTSSFCSAEGCVAVEHRDRLVAVRDDKHPGGGELVFTPEEWDAFLAGAKAGEFDRATDG